MNNITEKEMLRLRDIHQNLINTEKHLNLIKKNITRMEVIRKN